MAEKEKDDFRARNYQVALREIAIEKNTIIYLPTGSGKTFIAVLVLKHLSPSLAKPYSQGGKISFIVVNTVALVDQHAKCIEKRTTLKVGRFSGDMNLDFWPKTKWYEEFDKYQVFVMTIQILVNLTNQNFLDLNKVNLIVFDECHRGVSDQPMRQLCKSFENLSEPPRILGLTATLLNGNCKPNKVMEEVKALEVTYHSQVATVDKLSEVISYSTNPEEKIEFFQSHQLTSIEYRAKLILTEMAELLTMVNEPDYCNPIPKADLKPIGKNEGLKKLRNTVIDIAFHLDTLGTYGGCKAVLAHLIQIERLKKHCDDRNLAIVLGYVQTGLSHVKKVLENSMKGYDEEEQVFRFSSDKVKKLINIFDQFKQQSKEELCALVFTKRRFTAKVLFYILDKLSKNSETYSHMKPNFMVGYNSNPFNDTRENLYTSKKNREVLQAFDNKDINVLIASNVLEEGVDITTCSLVVKFDHPEEYRSYIQSKGRARFPTSLFFMMVENKDVAKFLIRLGEFKQIENQLNDFLIGQNQERKEPSTREIQNMYNEDELPPYYVDGPNSAKVDMVSAISLLSSYCMNLPCDKYTVLAPELFSKAKKRADGDVLISVTIVLPTACPLVEPIVGSYMRNIKLAKRAAALKACEALHRMGELDDHLLPKKIEIAEEDVNFLFKHYPRQKEPMAGTNKNKRLHKKQVPQHLKGPITPLSSVTLHIINLVPEFERKDEISQATLFDIYTSNLCFGLITPKPVSTICDFPIYVSMGTLNVNLKVNVKTLTLTKDNITDIKEFNVIVLSDILRSLREFLIFDKGKDAESLLMVPVNKKTKKIDFGVLKEYKTINNVMELTNDEKLKLDVTQETFLRKIVSPWYRDVGPNMRTYYLVVGLILNKNAKSPFPTEHTPQDGDDNQRHKKKATEEHSDTISSNYLVTEVSLNKNATSVFPNDGFRTYEDYYKQKHGLRLVNPQQPLLYVKSLTKKLNYIKPQGMQAKRKREKLYEELEIHLIPELVIKQDFPSELWIQASLLPTIISKLSFLFRLEEFRAKIARESNLGQENVPFKQPLQLDEYLLNYEPNIEKPKEVNVLVPEPKEEIPTLSLSNINVNKDYAKKMLDMEYPWKDTEEPKDIERDLDVTILDVDYYEKFISRAVKEDDVLLKNEAPRRHKQLSLTYFKEFVEKPIRLLDNENLSEGPELRLVYKAMTTAKANDIVNMERLETLGDSFLKLFSSIYIYLKFPKYNEGLSTNLKGRLVSNKNLYYLGNKKNIGGIMKTTDLQISDWLPPGFKIPDLVQQRLDSKEISLASIYHFSVPFEEQIAGVLSKETINYIMEESSEEDPSEEGLINDIAPFFKSNYVGDKNVADCVEALLGAYFQTCGIIGGIRFMEWIGIIPSSENLLNLLNRIPKNPILNDKSTLRDIDYHIPYWKDIEIILGYHFKNRAYLLQALTHSSYSPNRITQSYEKLEFLGDAILDFLITCHIFESCGNLDPGELTDLRSALVNNNTFASLVVRCQFHKYLLMINAKLQSLIDRFAQYIESKKYEIDDEVLILLEESEDVGLNLAEYIDVPKVLGDIFEALAGAVYLDCGKDLKTVWTVFYRIMWKEIDAFSTNVPKNLVRRLYEWNPNPHPKFGKSIDVEKGKVMVPLQFMSNGRQQRVFGFGSNKVMAKKAAAKLALRSLS